MSEETSEELLNRVVNEQVENKLSSLMTSAQEQAKINEFKSMQDDLSKIDDIPDGVKKYVDPLLKADYNKENYGEIKGYHNSSGSFIKKNVSNNTYESTPPREGGSSGMDYSGSNNNFKPKDMTDLSQVYDKMNPIGSFSQGCSIYRTYPDVDKDLFSHNKINALESGNRNAVERMKSQIRSGFDKMMERDRQNGYFDSISLV